MSTRSKKRSRSWMVLAVCEALEPRVFMTAAAALSTPVVHASSAAVSIACDEGCDDGSDDGSSDDGSGGDTSGDGSGDGSSDNGSSGDGSGDGTSDGSGDGSGDDSGGDGYVDSGDNGDNGTDTSGDGGGGDYYIYPPGDPYHLTVKALSPYQIELTWAGDTANTNGYSIAREAPGQNFTTIGSVDWSTPWFYDASVQPNTTYSYAVVAYNDGGYSNYSNVATLTTPDIPRPPVVCLDAANNSQVYGWSVDPNTPNAPVSVSVAVDGVMQGVTSAVITRPGLVAIYGSANHGFSLSFPAMTPGVHRFDIYAADTTTGVVSLIVSRTINTNRAPVGHFDRFNPSTILGWTYDPDNSVTALQVQYAIDNNAPVAATADLNRPGLVAITGSASHGFSFALPQLTAGRHVVSVYAADTTSGAMTLLERQTLTISNPVFNPLPSGLLDSVSRTRVHGWGLVTGTPSASVYVRIDIDNTPGTPVLANLYRPGLAAAYGNGNHGFDEALALSPGQHTVTIYLLSSLTGTPTLLGSRLV